MLIRSQPGIQTVLLSLALLCIIYASILPGINATALQIVVGVTTIVVTNAAISVFAERQGGFAPRSALTRYCAGAGASRVLSRPFRLT